MVYVAIHYIKLYKTQLKVRNLEMLNFSLYELGLKVKIKIIIFSGLLKSERICSRCPQLQVCMMHYKSRENGDAITSGVEELYKELMSSLRKEDFQFFRKWYELLLSEAFYEAAGKNKTCHIWQKSSADRELRGVCFSNLVLCHMDTTSDMKFHYTFTRQKDHFNQQTPMNLIPIIVGDRVIISRENSCVFNETTGSFTFFLSST